VTLSEVCDELEAAIALDDPKHPEPQSDTRLWSRYLEALVALGEAQIRLVATEGFPVLGAHVMTLEDEDEVKSRFAALKAKAQEVLGP
jgi:hypothetical protein